MITVSTHNLRSSTFATSTTPFRDRKTRLLSLSSVLTSLQEKERHFWPLEGSAPTSRLLWINLPFTNYKNFTSNLSDASITPMSKWLTNYSSKQCDTGDVFAYFSTNKQTAWSLWQLHPAQLPIMTKQRLSETVWHRRFPSEEEQWSGKNCCNLEVNHKK